MWNIWTFACEMLQSFHDQIVGVKRGYWHWQDDTEVFHEQDVWERDAGVRGLISLFGNMCKMKVLLTVVYQRQCPGCNSCSSQRMTEFNPACLFT